MVKAPLSSEVIEVGPPRTLLTLTRTRRSADRPLRAGRVDFPKDKKCDPEWYSSRLVQDFPDRDPSRKFARRMRPEGQSGLEVRKELLACGFDFRSLFLVLGPWSFLFGSCIGSHSPLGGTKLRRQINRKAGAGLSPRATLFFVVTVAVPLPREANQEQRTKSENCETRGEVSRFPPSLLSAQSFYFLENKFDCELYIATLKVAIRSQSFGGSDDAIRDIVSSGQDVKVCVIERIEHLAA